MKDISKKILLFLILQIIYPNIFYILLVPEIYTISIYVLYLLTNYITALADTMIRPLTKERNPSKIYDFLLLLLFFLAPFFLITAFYENTLLISTDEPVSVSRSFGPLGPYFLNTVLEETQSPFSSLISARSVKNTSYS